MTPEQEQLLLSVAAQLREVLARQDRLEARQTPPPVRKTYSVGQAAERLNLSAWTVRRACKTHRIVGAVKATNGRDWLIPHAVLARLEADGLPPDPNTRSMGD